MNKQITYERIREIRDKMFPPELEFGCEVEFADIGIWGHEANHYLWVINDVRNNEKGDVLDNIWQCTQRGWTHTPYSGWKPKQGYGDIAEILETKDGIKTLSHHYSDKIEILGRPVSLNEILLMIKNHKAYIDCPEMALQLMAMFVTSSDFDLTLSIQDQTQDVLEDILKIID